MSDFAGRSSYSLSATLASDSAGRSSLVAATTILGVFTYIFQFHVNFFLMKFSLLITSQPSDQKSDDSDL